MTRAPHLPVPPNHRPGGHYLTVAEVADELHISKMTIYRLISQGLLPAKRIGRSLRVLERDLDSFLRAADTSDWEDDE